MSGKHRDLHLYLNDRLCEIEESGVLAKEYRYTLVARHLTNENAHIVTSNDDLGAVARVLTGASLPIVYGPDAQPSTVAPGVDVIEPCVCGHGASRHEQFTSAPWTRSGCWDCPCQDFQSPSLHHGKNVSGPITAGTGEKTTSRARDFRDRRVSFSAPLSPESGVSPDSEEGFGTVREPERGDAPESLAEPRAVDPPERDDITAEQFRYAMEQIDRAYLSELPSKKGDSDA